MNSTMTNGTWLSAAACAPETLGYAPISAYSRDRIGGFGVDIPVTSKHSFEKSAKSPKFMKQFVQTSPGSTVTGSPG